jgi:hypothetical protein
VLGALTLVSLAAALVAGRVSGLGGPWLWNLDMPRIDYPLAVFFHDALAQGRLPLWNDQLGLGFPLYAEGQIGAFYPPNWLIYLLPPLPALDLSRVLHLAVAGVGTGLLTLRLSGSRAGALLAAAGAVLAGGVVAKLQWTNLVAAYAWLPWVLLPLVRRPAATRRGLVAAGILWGFQALAGHPNTWLLTGIAAAVLLATGARRQSLRHLAAFGALGVAVGAVQLLPTFLLTTLSVRATGLSEADLFASAATPFDPLGLFFASAFTQSSQGTWDIRTVWYPNGIFALLEVSTYVGIPLVALAVVGARLRRARPLLVGIAMLVLIPVVAAFHPSWWAQIPLLSGLRSPVRAYMVAGLLLAIVAALGVARLRGLARTSRTTAIAWSALAAASVAWIAAVGAATVAPAAFEALWQRFALFPGPAPAAGARELAIAALTSPWPLLAEIGIGLAGAAMVSWGRGWRPGAAVLVAVFPLALFSPMANDTRPESEFSFANTPFVQTLSDAAAHRVLTIGEPGWYPGMPDQLAAAGVPDLRMFSSLNLLATERLAEDVRQQGPQAEALRRAAGIDIVVTFGAPCPGQTVATVDDQNATVCRPPDTLRPPYWIPDSAVAATGTTIWPALTPADAEVSAAQALESALPATVEAFDTVSARFVVDAPADGWLFIDRAWWSAWRTTVDGQVAPAFRAMAGQLIRVPGGRHVVEQSLIPWDALAGLALAALAVVTALAWLRRGRRRSTWARRRPSPRG